MNGFTSYKKKKKCRSGLPSPSPDNGIHVSFSILVSSGYMPRSGIAGSYGGFMEKAMATLQYSCLENPMDGGAW